MEDNILSEEIIVNPFETRVRVVVSETIEKGLTYWRDNVEPKHGLNISDYIKANGLTLRMVNDGVSYYGIILCLSSPYSTIAHELFHLVMAVANHKGASWSEESDEWYAYCLSDLWEQVAELMNKYKKL